ncbi:hypothetical protein L249_7393 [Ophiocordyceps polyrhachis-furcata BCC 54312]|uniref:Uncharacterized protein n=1 Tax=Ophiocordyceps polyrhachis-furcata BCC 54312 TaxID=1330021 RepID=A0A367LAD0_9HYPO|nr:hypothetical protein L249_7393 [Ophiocordyceps polyrhachis-furcata BCC 54312]
MRSEEISSENIRWLVFCQDDYSEVGEAAQIAAEPVGLCAGPERWYYQSASTKALEQASDDKLVVWLVFCQDDYSEVGEAAQIAAEPVGLVS